jgi:hypothetical protein
LTERIYDSNRAPLAIDRDGSDWNPAGLTVLGLRAHETIGWRLLLLIPESEKRRGTGGRDKSRASVALAASEVLALAKANRAYEAKFWYIFIVCATGKSAVEILGLLEQRLHNPVEMEIKNAAEQQHLILRLRLRKLLGEWAWLQPCSLDTTAGELVAWMRHGLS